MANTEPEDWTTGLRGNPEFAERKRAAATMQSSLDYAQEDIMEGNDLRLLVI